MMDSGVKGKFIKTCLFYVFALGLIRVLLFASLNKVDRKAVEKPGGVITTPLPYAGVVIIPEEECPSEFREFELVLTIRTNAPQDADYANKQASELARMVSTVPSVDKATVKSVSGVVRKNGTEATFIIE